MDYINLIADRLGLDAGEMLAMLVIISLVCRLIGKAIPDTATGALGIVRKVAKAIGLYIGNRIDSGVSTNDVSKASMSIASVARLARKQAD